MKSSEILGLLKHDGLAAFAYKPTAGDARYEPVYIRGLHRTIRGQWRFMQVKRYSHDWRDESGTFRPGEIITAAEAHAIASRQQAEREEAARQRRAADLVSGRLRLLGIESTASSEGVAIPAASLHDLVALLPPAVDVLDRLSRCETIAASGVYHLRCLTNAGRKLGGGADTKTLCGRDAAWDIDGPVTPESMQRMGHYARPCETCVAVVMEAKS